MSIRLSSADALTAQDKFSAPPTKETWVTDVFEPGVIDIDIHGNYTGTITLQGSYDDFNTVLDIKDFTANAKVRETAEVGARQRLRLGFKIGNFTAGSAAVSVRQDPNA